MTGKMISRVTILLAVIALTALPLFATTTTLVDGNHGVRYASSVSGTVSDVTGTTIKLLNGLVTVDASTAVISAEENRTALTIAAITVGTVIDVSGNPGVGNIIAARIRVHGPKSDGKLSGTITAASAGTITVNGAVITLNAATIYEPYRRMIISAANFTVGTAVSVEVLLVQGNLVATEASLGGDDD